jgi:hypothetical protein
MTKPSPKSADEPNTPEQDPRHPDTNADAGGQPPALNPEDYGFRAIEVRDVDETGPGSVEPTRMEPLSQTGGTTFAERAKGARRGESKAVQSAENK